MTADPPSPRTIRRIPQRGQMDCIIPVVAMVTGKTYESVLADKSLYADREPDGKFRDWWVNYLRDEGFLAFYRPLTEAKRLAENGCQFVGIVGMTIDHLSARHVAALDALGVIDPADGFPDHMSLEAYAENRRYDHCFLDSEFLAVGPPPSDRIIKFALSLRKLLRRLARFRRLIVVH